METACLSRAPARLLDLEAVQARRAAHAERVDRWVVPHQERARRGEKHPVYDFLFDYYSHRASWLRRWHPGLGEIVPQPAAGLLADARMYRKTEYGLTADPLALPSHRRETVSWLHALLAGMQQRPAFFGCFGLHEWAMVYRLSQDDLRHARWPLRLPSAQIQAIVESHPICCTHFDAFRFFTPEARPLNRLQPSRATLPLLEQRGCLHANMDLYKWAFKLAPFTSSELVADCFALARDIREVDMRASPYDFRALGFAAIEIETPAGKAEYEAAQRTFTERGEPLRARLIATCEAILGA